MADSQNIPLFPLGTVLFPGGVLQLRIFEPRYLAMISHCMRQGSGFGVVLISSGKEAGEVAEFNRIGTLAGIEDFDQLEDGHLGITCRGIQRFHVTSHSVGEDQLITADMEYLAEEETPELPESYDKLKAFLRGLHEREDLKAWADTVTPDWDDSGWLACRLIEVLPLDMSIRQALLEMGTGERLQNLSHVMENNGML